MDTGTSRTPCSSISCPEFDGEWIYPRKRLQAPRAPDFQKLTDAERFRCCAAAVAYRCETRIDKRSEVQRRTAPKLVAP